MLNVQILLFEGVDELDAVAPFEVFQCAAGLGWQLEVACVTLDLTPEVSTAHGLRLCPQGQLGGDPKPALVLVPPSAPGLPSCLLGGYFTCVVRFAR